MLPDPKPVFAYLKRHARDIVVLMAIGAIGGWIALGIGIPMPFLIGSLFPVSIVVIFMATRNRQVMGPPEEVRRYFIALIGAMIGTRFTPELVSAIPGLWPGLVAVPIYTVLGFGVGYIVLGRLGGYDAKTAIYAGMPGGFVEAIEIGRKIGGNVEVITAQHFIRIVLVVTLVPTLFLFWSGTVVGSASGVKIDPIPAGVFDVVALALIGLVGIFASNYMHLPAPHLMGPLLLSALLHGTGIVDVHTPNWLMFLAQLVIGVGLGAQFRGLRPTELVRMLGLGIVYIFAMLILSGLTAWVLVFVVPLDFDALFISFAPGGVPEMGLIALSLGISPVVVALHHLVRILVAAFVAGLLSDRIK